jgi:hypothetical protein
MAVRNKKLPPIPKRMFSVLGPLPVALVEELHEKDQALGMVRFKTRAVQLEKDMCPLTQWQTFWHEAAHVAMFDGGVNDGLTHELEEAVCNAMGTYFAAAVQAGYIKVAR